MVLGIIGAWYNKDMNFLKDVRASIYGPGYYAGLKEKPLGYSIKYFFLLILCLAVISAGVMLFTVIPAINGFLTSFGQQVVAYYPDALQITIANGKVSTNVPEPYFLKLPPALQDRLTQSSDAVSGSSSIQNLLTIDTKDPFTIDEFRNDRTLLLLTGDSIAYEKDQQGQSIVVQPLGASTTIAIDKAGVISFVNKAQPYLKIMDWAIAILMPIGIFCALAFRLVYLFFLALLIWGLARISKLEAGYQQSYRWGIHLMTLPLILGTLFWLIAPSFGFPFFFTVMALIMAGINLKTLASSPSTHP